MRAWMIVLGSTLIGCSAKAPVTEPKPEQKATANMFGSVQGTVKFAGTPAAMKVPSARSGVEYCKKHSAKADAVVVNDGKLEGALVRIEPSAIKGSWEAPAEPAHLTIENCSFKPRIVAMLAGGRFDVKNLDGIDHTVNARRGDEAIFQVALPKKGDPAVKKLEVPGIYKLTDTDEPWSRAFVIASDHPFYALSDASGAYKLDKVPVGRYFVETWHPIYGKKKMPVEIADGKTITIDFSYAGNEQEPPENQGELKAIE